MFPQLDEAMGAVIAKLASTSLQAFFDRALLALMDLVFRKFGQEMHLIHYYESGKFQDVSDSQLEEELRKDIKEAVVGLWFTLATVACLAGLAIRGRITVGGAIEVFLVATLALALAIPFSLFVIHGILDAVSARRRCASYFHRLRPRSNFVALLVWIIVSVLAYVIYI
ncbi:hypothetical protein [Actinopolymorpha alba]|uniref:hypothetical protein n=1 Tax=Actinopolymorpha alba TaxID=533267 RepID=UPI00038098A6|nr:hypothetical protein [Actinopolymorpha alba]